MTKLALAVFTAACIASAAARAQETLPNDPIARSTLPPELILQHQKAIRLTDAQREAMVAEIKRAQSRIVDIQWEVQRAFEPFAESLAKDRVDEAQALAQLDKVLAAEREFKRAHIALAVRLKNLLTPEQQRQLFELRSGAQRGGEPRPAAPR
jgi:Spy/CpxP family protein refolding chaperone